MISFSSNIQSHLSPEPKTFNSFSISNALSIYLSIVVSPRFDNFLNLTVPLQSYCELSKSIP